MDGEEDEFMSGNQSDDGGGTPVQDEHPTSEAEDERSDGHQSEDEGSNNEAPQPMDTSGAMSDSDAEAPKDEDSDDESPVKGRKDDSSDDESPTKPQHDHSDIESPAKERDDSSDEDRPAQRQDSDNDSPAKPHDDSSDDESSRKQHRDQSDAESPAKHRNGISESDDETTATNDNRSHTKEGVENSDNDEDGDRAVKSPITKMSRSDDDEEPPAKRQKSDQEGEPSSSPRSRGSDQEGGDKRGSDSESEGEVRKRKRQLDSEEEGDEAKGEGGGGGGGRWKGVMQSDSEEEEGERTKAKSDTEQDGGQKDDEEDKPVKRKKAILSDSEDEDEDKTDKPVSPVKRSGAVSDGEDSDSGSSSGPDQTLAKLRELGSASEEDEPKEEAQKDEKALFGSDSEEEDAEEKMIADIFGESGDEEEEFTGFNQEDLEQENEAPQQEQQQEESDSDEGVERGAIDTSHMSDFDIMLAKRKAMNSKRRKHRDGGGTFISDADDVVSAMINKMTEAAEEDRTLNSQKKPALKKLTLLPTVVMHLKKQDLKETFIDSGVMSAIKEWISPLPDKSLPALRIREELLRILHELPSVSQETLKHSGIGRAVMFLYKHPKESRNNKDLALKLINEWSRPIFGLTSNYKGMTREERQQRDLDQQMPQKRRLSSGGQTPRRDLEKQLTGEEKALRPGDPGFCARARVPMPSNKDYVVRPKWNVEGDSTRFMRKGLSLLEKHKRRFAEERKQKRHTGYCTGTVKKGISRVDKQMRRFQDIRRSSKTGHAVKISVEGNKMPL
uniref:TFIIS N-terminal domain-containing protein n=1 Tax=Knipowitschia caucasica TaxID=637954 RepID=A0AAV2J1K1_KNICA